tara:strand:+ start:1008 stop:2057 length:1050 start_codon:yes stop_codon:yes gene_type:complete
VKKISFISFEDNANVFTNWSSFINSVSSEYESKSFCMKEHPYKYALHHDYNLVDLSERQKKDATQWLLDSDYVIYSEEDQNCYFQYSTALQFKSVLGVDPIFETLGKKIAFYSGTAYRKKSQMFNQMDQMSFDRILSPLDLYRLTNRDDKTGCIFMCEKDKISSDLIKQNIVDRFNQPEWVISHIPTNRQIKGSDFLLKIMEKIQKTSKNPIKYIEKTGLSPQESLEIKKNSCFYIDTLSIGLGILATGAHGISSLEALSYGNLVFSSTYNMEKEAIDKASLPFFNSEVEYPVHNLGKTVDSAYKELEMVLNLDKEVLIEMALRSYAWYQNTSTPQKFVEKFIYEIEKA